MPDKLMKKNFFFNFKNKKINSLIYLNKKIQKGPLNQSPGTS